MIPTTSQAAFTTETNNAGNSFSTGVAPARAPRQYTAVPQGNALEIGWADIDPNTLDITLFRSATPGGPYTEIATVPVAGTFTDSPGPGTFYYVTQATANGWASPNSNEFALTYN